MYITSTQLPVMLSWHFGGIVWGNVRGFVRGNFPGVIFYGECWWGIAGENCPEMSTFLGREFSREEGIFSPEIVGQIIWDGCLDPHAGLQE